MEGEGEDERYRYCVYTSRGGGEVSGGAVVASEEAEGAPERFLLCACCQLSPMPSMSGLVVFKMVLSEINSKSFMSVHHHPISRPMYWSQASPTAGCSCTMPTPSTRCASRTTSAASSR